MLMREGFLAENCSFCSPDYGWMARNILSFPISFAQPSWTSCWIVGSELPYGFITARTY
uniref:Uncharacterized protein n=1 Tax=Picea glauca TaxID=3330 RepID=A0A101LXY8_PICGL|nr:hypothetical protein ABT39_MTgene5599 [Picea glauca]